MFIVPLKIIWWYNYISSSLNVLKKIIACMFGGKWKLIFQAKLFADNKETFLMMICFNLQIIMQMTCVGDINYHETIRLMDILIIDLSIESRTIHLCRTSYVFII